jgi:hypothetical protein
VEIESYAVAIVADYKSQQARSDWAKRAYQGLLSASRPVVAVLRQGELVFDMLTLNDDDLDYLGAALAAVTRGASRP